MVKLMIAVRCVSKSFGKKEVLREVSLEVDPCHIVGLLGWMSVAVIFSALATVAKLQARDLRPLPQFQKELYTP